MRLSPAALIALVILAGCGSGVAMQSPTGISNTGVHQTRSGSWMDPAAKGDDLIYVSTFPFQRQVTVEIFTWRERKNVGRLTDFSAPQHLCSDKAGDVFIPDAVTAKIYEYAHGGTSPIATLDDSGNDPHACAFDEVTGDVAVLDSGVAIYHHGSGTPTRHTDAHFASYSFCGYDDAGNLFVDGKNPSDRFRFAEIQQGRKSFTDISLHDHVLRPGSVQWDGKYMAVGDENDNRVYQFEISGSTAVLKGTTDLDGGEGPIRQFWIPKFSKGRVNPRATHIIAGQFLFSRHDPGDVAIWDYPAGGHAPKHKITDIEHPLGVTVSLATK